MTFQLSTKTGFRFSSFSVVALFGLMTLTATMPATAEGSSTGDEQTWQMATRNADIQEFVAQVAKITGKTFVVDPKLKGQVNVVSETPLGKDGVYELFLSVLRLQNYTAVPSGDVIRIQQSATGKQTPGAPGGAENAAPEELVTEIIAVQNVKSEELLKILRPLIPQYGHIGSVSQPNVIILSDHADNIIRLKAIIADIDVAQTNDIVMVPLQEAWVGNVVDILQKVAPDQLGPNAQGPQRIQIIANERNNSLVLRGQTGAIAELIQIIEKLDRPTTTNDATQVVMLNHGDAENVANILESLVGQRDGGESTKTGSAVTIQPDTSLNAIVVRADPTAMNEILSIVQRLDTSRAQVLIEAAIVEITLTDNLSAGIEMAGADSRGKSVPLLSTALGGGLSGLLANLGNTNGTFNQNVLTSLGATTQPTIAAAKIDLDGISFGAVVTALASMENANLLSTPSIVTLDNTEAKILVGQEVPFRSGSFTTTTDGANNPFTTVTREDVGIELTVTPHVYDNQEVRMEVAQNISNVLNNTVSNSTFADVVTSKRSIETTVLAASGETIILGGLIQDDVTDTDKRVPVLGNIPVVGNLFKSKTKRQAKTNLVVFIRPTVIATSNDGNAVTDQRLNGIWEVGGAEGDPMTADDLFEGRSARE
jgi:general secretion pathway protein D